MGVSTSQIKDKSVRESLRRALANGKISDKELLQIIASTLDGKKGITPTERNDLNKLTSSTTLSPLAKGWLSKFLKLCDRQSSISLRFDKLQQAYSTKGSQPPSGWSQSDFGKSDRGGRGSCAIRVSTSLQAIGWTFTRFKKPHVWQDKVTKRKLPVNAAELRDYIKTTKLGSGVTIDPHNPISRYRQGIIFLAVSGASGHITLWDGNKWNGSRANFEDSRWAHSSGWMTTNGSNATFWDLRPHWI
jgi:hypothetical protein